MFFKKKYKIKILYGKKNVEVTLLRSSTFLFLRRNNKAMCPIKSMRDDGGFARFVGRRGGGGGGGLKETKNLIMGIRLYPFCEFGFFFFK